MDLWEAVVVAFRRWYVLVPVFVVGVYVALQLAGSVAPVHGANATVQFIPAKIDIDTVPAAAEADDPVAVADALNAARAAAFGNPYSDPRSLAIAVELSATAESFVSGLAERGLDAQFEISTDPRQPVLYITTASTSPRTALDTLAELIAFTEDVSDERQLSQFSENRTLHVTPDVLRQDEQTTIDLTSRTRARILLLVVAAVAAVGAAVLVETIFGTLERRRSGGSDGEPTEPAVVWFGVPVHGGAQPPLPSAPAPQQPYLAAAPFEPPRSTGTDDDADVSGRSRGSRWSR